MIGQTTEGYVLFPLHQPYKILNASHRKTEGPTSQQEDPRTRFYKIYRREAEEYDKEFMKKYDEDLNTTLIFVSLARCPDTRVLS